MFKYNGGYIYNIQNNKVVAIKDFKDIEAQPVEVANKITRRGGNIRGQRWKIVYTHQMGDEAYRQKGQMSKESGIRVDETFFLRSRLPMQRVAECAGASNVTLKKWYKNRRA
jgi:hypothetical protein